MKFSFAFLSFAFLSSYFRGIDSFVAPHHSIRFKNDLSIQSTSGGMIDETGPLKKIILTDSKGCEAEIFTLGACVTSFKVDGHDSLFVRPDAKLDGSKPISGGLPHCFPQFGPGKIQQHGFARNMEWEIESLVGGEIPSVTLKLKESEATLAMWPHKFECTYEVSIASKTLKTELKIKNADEKPFEFQCALHSYFSVSDVQQTKVSSPLFPSSTYLDKTNDPPIEMKWSENDVKVSKPVDYVFYDVSGDIEMVDSASNRKLMIKNEGGYADTVIWSPFGDENMGYKNFLCVESAKVSPLRLSPGEEWIGLMTLVPSN
mmetsp:Transcript_13160/g.18507  ORF Transcript_13160/g.18507 Transcript_13160/m.18507 type:complete len:317 (+) Transcript_13160:24-974(+)